MNPLRFKATPKKCMLSGIKGPTRPFIGRGSAARLYGRAIPDFLTRCANHRHIGTRRRPYQETNHADETPSFHAIDDPRALAVDACGQCLRRYVVGWREQFERQHRRVLSMLNMRLRPDVTGAIGRAFAGALTG
jgi:hypothetical protein